MSEKDTKTENHPSPVPSAAARIIGEMKRNHRSFMIKLGAHVTHIALFLGKKLSAAVVLAAGRVFYAVRGALSRLVAGLPFGAGKRISIKDRITAKAISVKQSYAAAYRENGKKGVLLTALHGVGKALFGDRGIAVTAFNYCAPVVSIAFLVMLVRYAAGIEYGVSVECNGRQLGIISEEVVYTEAQNIIQDKITYLEGDETVTVESRLSLQMMDDSAAVIDSEELAEVMLLNTDRDLVEATGVYLNGELVGVVEDTSEIEATLDDLLERYDAEGVGEVYFKDEIEYVDGLYLSSTVIEDDSIVDLFSSMRTTEKYYIIESGDAPIIIAQKCGITLDELVELNPDILTTCFIGQEVLLNREEPYLTVLTTKTVEYTDSVDYETITTENPNQYKGIDTVVVKGVEGEAEYVAEVVYENGYEISRTILSEKIIKEPVTQEISVGTMSAKTVNKAYSYRDGIFCWPVNGGYISSYMGDGRGHKGLDIAAPAGTVIFAAESGTVEKAAYGWNGGYGNWVVINHGNGYKTVYAHQSNLLVSAGQYVEKGDPIGQVGNTGNSFGNHLHFEVRYYGTYMNPLNYLNAS